ncbi:MAG: glycosyltransferase family 2 protein [Patescibacteria group bacterium]
MEKITIAIVNWNTGKLLAECLKSLLTLPQDERGIIDTVVVVDNASSDHSLQYARQAVAPGDPVLFIEQGENIGFARGNNIVLSQFAGGRHILLLNPDTKVLPGSIRALSKALERNPQAGIVGPKLLNADNSLQSSVRAFPSWLTLAFYLFKLNRLLPNSRAWRQYLQKDFDYSREQTTSQVMGAAFLIRNETLQAVGLLDEAFWIWFEEVDYCKRAADAGWQVLYTPTAKIIHYGGVSFGQWGGWKRYIEFMRSAAHYAGKHLI